MSDRPGPGELADPRQALRALIEQGEGTSASATMLRLLWLRQDHPSAAVTTDPVHLTDTAVVIRATIAVQGGGSGSGLAAANVDDPSEWAEAVERAETNAISRALDTLGYVLERASMSVAATTTTPPTRQQPQVQPQPQPQQQQGQPQPPTQPQSPPGPRPIPTQPRPTPIQRMEESAPPVVNALRRAQTRPQAVPPPQADAPAEDDAHLPEYSWTGFWNAARGFGLDAKRVEEILGRPARDSSPKEAVEALRAAGAWGPTPTDG